MKNIGFLSEIWEYITELIASILIWFSLFYFVPEGVMQTFLSKTAEHFNSLVLVLFSASLAIWLTFVNITGSDFGNYLIYRKSFDAYNNGFKFAIVLYFISSVALIMAIAIKHSFVLNGAIFLLIYGLLNILTLIKNGAGIIRLYSKFQAEMKNVEQKNNSNTVNPEQEKHE